MSATEKIVEFIESVSEPFTATEVSSATSVKVAQVRPILRALVERDRIEVVATKRQFARGRPSNAFVRKA